MAWKRDKQTSEDDRRFDLVKRAEIVFVSCRRLCQQTASEFAKIRLKVHRRLRQYPEYLPLAPFPSDSAVSL